MSSEILVTQIKIRSGDSIMTTWVDDSPKLKPGVVIELKKDPRRWTIEQVYGTQTASDIDARGWDNNDYSKHEGLFK